MTCFILKRSPDIHEGYIGRLFGQDFFEKFFIDRSFFFAGFDGLDFMKKRLT